MFDDHTELTIRPYLRQLLQTRWCNIVERAAFTLYGLRLPHSAFASTLLLLTIQKNSFNSAHLSLSLSLSMTREGLSETFLSVFVRVERSLLMPSVSLAI